MEVSGPNCISSSPQSPIHLPRGVKDCIQGFPSDVGLQADIGRNDINNITSFRDDGMDSDGIFVLERLPLSMNREDAQTCGIQRVDSLMGNGTRVSRFSLVLDELGQKAISCPVH